MSPGEPAFAFVTGNYKRNVSLPGVELRIAKGPKHLPGDIPYMGLYIASPARHCLENLAPTRDRGGVSRGTGPAEVEGFLMRLLEAKGEEGLNQLRDHARSIRSDLLDEVGGQFGKLDGIIGALLGSHDHDALQTKQGIAWAKSEGFDTGCVETLDVLFAYLGANPSPVVPDVARGTAAEVSTAFVEAYFSNYIEGTTFLVQEAKDIVFLGQVPDRRSKDGHDVISTYGLLADYGGMRRMPDDFDEFVARIKGTHSLLMAERPEVGPGVFKDKVNRAGNTVFVAPEMILGTLRRGHEMLSAIVDPFARAAFVHFLVSAVHPFADGNGRLSRIMMANELTAGGLSRAVVPTVYRDDYIGGQRALSRKRDPGANIRAIAKCQAVTASIVENDVDVCIAKWATTNAFLEPGVNAQLQAPNDHPVEVRDGVAAPKAYWDAEAQGQAFSL